MTYDCFCFFNELDLLEIRLNILDPHVDRFVIVESRETFSGKEKPLCLMENIGRFSKWKDKITHLIVDRYDAENSFERARLQKEMLREGLRGASDDDTVYYGDLDEIWNPKPVVDDRVYSLRQLNYCYFLNNRSSEEWVGTIVGKWGTVKTKPLAHWRANHENVLDDGGFHFTNMGGAEQIRRKLDSYDHQEYNHADIKEDIEYRMENGEDYVGRKLDWQGKPFSFRIDESELPKYIIDNKQKYVAYFKP